MKFTSLILFSVFFFSILITGAEEPSDYATTYQESYTFKNGTTYDVAVKLTFINQAGKIASDAHSEFMKKAIRNGIENSNENPTADEGRKALEAEILVQLKYTKFSFKNVEVLPMQKTPAKK